MPLQVLEVHAVCRHAGLENWALVDAHAGLSACRTLAPRPVVFSLPPSFPLLDMVVMLVLCRAQVPCRIYNMDDMPFVCSIGAT